MGMSGYATATATATISPLYPAFFLLQERVAMAGHFLHSNGQGYAVSLHGGVTFGDETSVGGGYPSCGEIRCIDWQMSIGMGIGEGVHRWS